MEALEMISPAALRLRKTMGGANAELWEFLTSGGAGAPKVRLLSGGDPINLDAEAGLASHTWQLKLAAEFNLRSVFFAQPLHPYASWSIQAITSTPLSPRPSQAAQEAQVLGRYVAGRLQFDVAPTHRPPRDAPPLLYTISLHFHSPTPADYSQVLVLELSDGDLMGFPLSVSMGDSLAESPADWANLPLEAEVVSTKSSHLIIHNSSEEEQNSQHSAFFIDAPPYVHKPLPPLLSSELDRKLLEAGLAEIGPRPDGLRLGESWSASNYRERMLHLLDLEQAARATLLASNTALSRLRLAKIFTVAGDVGDDGAGEVRIAAPGELLGRIALDGVLSEDRPGGRLLIRECETVDVELVEGPNGVALGGGGGRERRLRWECRLEAKQRDGVLFRLPAEMVETHSLLTALELVETGPPELAVQAKIVFRLAALAFAEWRYALKHLPSADFLLPEPKEDAKSAGDLDPALVGDEICAALNAAQRSLVAEVMTEATEDWPPPLLVVGPWGTGKTLSLAWLCRALLAKKADARILLCTQSNSAADLYLQKYFHAWIAAGELPKPLRLYYIGRKLEAVSAVGRAYATIDAQGSLRWPTREELAEAPIVLTTLSTAKHLLDAGTPFSHILIDEAAQAMEPATLVPLSLAAANTRIVLAGDPQQSGPLVHSQLARRHGLAQSLLERLWAAYPPGHPLRIHLRVNYRSCPGLVDYLGRHFYQEDLLAASELPGHPKLPPIALYPVRGVDRHDPASGGFHNLAEVRRVVALVTEMGGEAWWPRETWGPFDPGQIGVLCPYQDQVLRIRQQLRASANPRLRGVSVEHIQNVQGKEYRVVIVSTVRTLGTCDGLGPSGLEGGGFLSDPRLLNTALTRAQTLLAVVGDPVSLATLGQAKGLWRRILDDWGPRCDQPQLWSTLQQHIDFVEASLRGGKETGAQRLFLNPYSANFSPAAASASAAPSTESSPSLLRVLVQRESGGVTETWVPASLLQPYLDNPPNPPPPPPLVSVPTMPLVNGETTAPPAVNGAELSGPPLYHAAMSPPQPPPLPPPLQPHPHFLHFPHSLDPTGLPQPHPPLLLPWQYPMAMPFPIPLPYSLPPPPFLFQASAPPQPPSLLDSSFPCPPGLSPSPSPVLRSVSARRSANQQPRNDAAATPSPASSPSSQTAAPAAAVEVVATPPLNDSDNFPPLAPSAHPERSPFAKAQ